MAYPARMTRTFHYRVPGRAQSAWPGLAAAAVMIALAARSGAPLWVWVAILPCLGICLLQIAFRPIYGLRLSPTALEIFDGFREEALPLTDIAHLRISGGDIRVVMVSGAERALPRRAVPNAIALIREMTARGIPVRQV